VDPPNAFRWLRLSALPKSWSATCGGVPDIFFRYSTFVPVRSLTSCDRLFNSSMKTLFYSVCVIALLASTLLTGCASMGGPYKLKQTRQDVDWAMVRYHNRQAFGFLTPQEQQSVAEAYKAYQSAFNAALKQAGGNYTSPTPSDVKQRADQLFSILDSIP
jgi:hypothetical protein